MRRSLMSPMVMMATFRTTRFLCLSRAAIVLRAPRYFSEASVCRPLTCKAGFDLSFFMAARRNSIAAQLRKTLVLRGDGTDRRAGSFRSFS